jgi:hypothetical protein
MAPARCVALLLSAARKGAVLNVLEVERKIKIYDRGVDVYEQTNSSSVEHQYSYRSGGIITYSIRLLNPWDRNAHTFRIVL